VTKDLATAHRKGDWMLGHHFSARRWPGVTEKPGKGGSFIAARPDRRRVVVPAYSLEKRRGIQAAFLKAAAGKGKIVGLVKQIGAGPSGQALDQ